MSFLKNYPTSGKTQKILGFDDFADFKLESTTEEDDKKKSKPVPLSSKTIYERTIVFSPAYYNVHDLGPNPTKEQLSDAGLKDLSDTTSFTIEPKPWGRQNIPLYGYSGVLVQIEPNVGFDISEIQSQLKTQLKYLKDQNIYLNVIGSSITGYLPATGHEEMADDWDFTGTQPSSVGGSGDSFEVIGATPDDSGVYHDALLAVSDFNGMRSGIGNRVITGDVFFDIPTIEPTKWIGSDHLTICVKNRDFGIDVGIAGLWLYTDRLESRELIKKVDNFQTKTFDESNAAFKKALENLYKSKIFSRGKLRIVLVEPKPVDASTDYTSRFEILAGLPTYFSGEGAASYNATIKTVGDKASAIFKTFDPDLVSVSHDISAIVNKIVDTVRSFYPPK